jgi:hypothetical protein
MRDQAAVQQHTAQKQGQSVLAPGTNSSYGDVFTVTTVIHQFMTDFNDTVTDEEKIVAMTKSVIKLMNPNDH